jgi:short-subunit dehydrogenase
VKTAVVTGASSGIGEATARELARRGWRTVLVARRQERLEQLASELGGEYEVADVSERDEVERAAAAILARHPQIDLLVYNAGIPGRGDFFSVEPERIEAVIRTNYLGGVWMVRALEDGLTPGSHVVNVVSVAGTVAFAPAGPYAASKHAQLAFSRSLAGLLGSRGVQVHTVLPGFVETEGFPQRSVLRNAFFRRAVIGPEVVAKRIADAVESGKRELFVPRWYRIFSLAQALLPGLSARLVARSGYRRQAPAQPEPPRATGP